MTLRLGQVFTTLKLTSLPLTLSKTVVGGTTQQTTTDKEDKLQALLFTELDETVHKGNRDPGCIDSRTN